MSSSRPHAFRFRRRRQYRIAEIDMENDKRAGAGARRMFQT
jgi:hypothetical protein